MKEPIEKLLNEFDFYYNYSDDPKRFEKFSLIEIEIKKRIENETVDIQKLTNTGKFVYERFTSKINK